MLFPHNWDNMFSPKTVRRGIRHISIGWLFCRLNERPVKESNRTSGISSLLPCFHESSKSPAMMKQQGTLWWNASVSSRLSSCSADSTLRWLAKDHWKSPSWKWIDIKLYYVLVQVGVASTGLGNSLLSVSLKLEMHIRSVCDLFRLMNMAS